MTTETDITEQRAAIAFTRKGISTRSTEDDESPNLEAVLCSTLEEFRQLREECPLQQQREAEFFTRFKQQDETVERLEERLRQIPGQSFLNSNIAIRVNNLGVYCYKLKPDIYDGSVPLREFWVQFNLLARANNWDNSVKVIVLASCLRQSACGKACFRRSHGTQEFTDCRT